MGHAFRGGVADFAAYARTSLDDLARLVELARTASPKATIGLSLYVATGTGPTVDYFLNIFAAGCFTNLAGPAGQVAAGIQGFGQLGVDRITVLPPTAESAAELAPHLFDR